MTYEITIIVNAGNQFEDDLKEGIVQLGLIGGEEVISFSYKILDTSNNNLLNEEHVLSKTNTSKFKCPTCKKN